MTAISTASPSSPVKPVLYSLKTPRSATLPSELPRSPYPGTPLRIKDEDGGYIKTPISPPTAYMDFLKAVASPAGLSTPGLYKSSGKSTPTSLPPSSRSISSDSVTSATTTTSSGTNISTGTCSCSCAERTRSGSKSPPSSSSSSSSSSAGQASKPRPLILAPPSTVVASSASTSSAHHHHHHHHHHASSRAPLQTPKSAPGTSATLRRLRLPPLASPLPSSPAGGGGSPAMPNTATATTSMVGGTPPTGYPFTTDPSPISAAFSARSPFILRSPLEVEIGGSKSKRWSLDRPITTAGSTTMTTSSSSSSTSTSTSSTSTAATATSASATATGVSTSASTPTTHPTGGNGNGIGSSDGNSGPRPVSVRQVVTRTVTYTPRMDLAPAPKGKKRRLN